MSRSLLVAALVLLSSVAEAATYAVPDGRGGYTYLEDTTWLTFTVGSRSFPPSYLRDSSPADRAALGILAVVETPTPDPTQFIVQGRSIRIVNGVPTVVWATTPNLSHVIDP